MSEKKETFDVVRDKRQKEIAERVSNTLRVTGKAWFSAYPGFGKTRTLIEYMIKPTLAKNPNALIRVFVGSDSLKEQWLERVPKSVQVLTWQGAYRHVISFEESHIDVYDEIHSLIATPEYSKVLGIKSKFKIACSGTVDKKTETLLRTFNFLFADNVSKDECLKNKWIKPTVEINYPVLLSKMESLRYVKLNEQYSLCLRMLDPDIQDPEKEDVFVSFRSITNVLNRPDVLKSVARLRKLEEGVVLGYASRGVKLYKERESLIAFNPRKLEVFKEIYPIMQSFGYCKTISFSLNTEFANKAALSLGGLPFHSKKSKQFNKKALEMFKTGSTNLLHTVSKVKEGFNLPVIDSVVNFSFTSQWVSKEQKDSRATRIGSMLPALVINF